MGFLVSTPTALQTQASQGLREAPGVGGGAPPAAGQACAPPQRPVGTGVGDVCTGRKCRGRGGAVAISLPPPFGFLFCCCLRPKKRWESGKVKVYHCNSLPLHLISFLRKPGWTFFFFFPLPRSLNTQGHEIPFLLLMWKRLGNMFLSRRWVIWQKDRVRWGQGTGARVLPNFQAALWLPGMLSWWSGGGLGAPHCPDSSLIRGVREGREDFEGVRRQEWVWPFQRLLWYMLMCWKTEQLTLPA